jgi:hypothetical protein
LRILRARQGYFSRILPSSCSSVQFNNGFFRILPFGRIPDLGTLVTRRGQTVHYEAQGCTDFDIQKQVQTDPFACKIVGWVVERKFSEKVRSVWGYLFFLASDSQVQIGPGAGPVIRKPPRHAFWADPAEILIALTTLPRK